MREREEGLRGRCTGAVVQGREVAGSFENRRCAVLCCCAFLCAAGLRLFLPSLKRREHIGSRSRERQREVGGEREEEEVEGTVHWCCGAGQRGGGFF